MVVTGHDEARARCHRAFEHPVVVGVFLDHVKCLGLPHQLELQQGFINLVPGPRKFPLEYPAQLLAYRFRNGKTDAGVLRRQEKLTGRPAKISAEM